jgi:IclR family acetate operon transcriptional repressor
MSSTPTTVVKALTLLNRVADHPGLTLSELASESGLPNATAHRLLRALIEFELVRVTSDHKHHLGSHCLALGSQFLGETDLRTEARPLLESLVDQTGETTHLGMRDGILVVYVDKVETSHPVRMFSRVGTLSPMYSTGIGKTLLAYGDEAVLERVIEAGLERRTPNTITDALRLRSELDRIRTRRYAIDDVENEAGIRCVAVPILTADGSALGAISISGPTSRISDERIEQLGHLLLDETRQLSRTFGYVAKEYDHA